MGLFVSPNVEKLRNKGDVVGLSRALRYKGGVLTDVCRRAAEALASIATPDAVNALINALDHPNHSVGKFAARALGKIGDEVAVEPAYIVTELADRLLGDGWQKRFVDKAKKGGIERVLL